MNICTAPIYKLEKLENLFIELTSKNCNQRCKACYIEFISNKAVKDFISTDKIKKALADTKSEELKCIYLTGAEPMTHPDFNLILRLCLRRSNVCICTNGSFLNEKKVRFLKKVENEVISCGFSNKIIFKLSLIHYNEQNNDSMKYRGNFRQTIFALKTLSNYNFRSVLSFQNYYKLEKEEIIDNLREIFEKNNIYNVELQINASYPDYEDKNFTKPSVKTDCMYGRVLTEQGVYMCPFLAGDYRGRAGLNLKDFSKHFTAETEFCATCSKNNSTIFSVD